MNTLTVSPTDTSTQQADTLVSSLNQTLRVTAFSTMSQAVGDSLKKVSKFQIT